MANIFLSPDGWIDLDTGEDVEYEPWLDPREENNMENPYLSPDGWIDLGN
jgi:hypothetical protein